MGGLTDDLQQAAQALPFLQPWREACNDFNNAAKMCNEKEKQEYEKEHKLRRQWARVTK